MWHGYACSVLLCELICEMLNVMSQLLWILQILIRLDILDKKFTLYFDNITLRQWLITHLVPPPSTSGWIMATSHSDVITSSHDVITTSHDVATFNPLSFLCFSRCTRERLGARGGVYTSPTEDEDYIEEDLPCDVPVSTRVLLLLLSTHEL